MRSCRSLTDHATAALTVKKRATVPGLLAGAGPPISLSTVNDTIMSKNIHISLTARYVTLAARRVAQDEFNNAANKKLSCDPDHPTGYFVQKALDEQSARLCPPIGAPDEVPEGPSQIKAERDALLRATRAAQNEAELLGRTLRLLIVAGHLTEERFYQAQALARPESKE